MSVKKFFATTDTTITNAFKEDLTTRGTDANMGLSDSLEIFYIIGHIYKLGLHMYILGP